MKSRTIRILRDAFIVFDISIYSHLRVFWNVYIVTREKQRDDWKSRKKSFRRSVELQKEKRKKIRVKVRGVRIKKTSRTFYVLFENYFNETVCTTADITILINRNL